jgi:HK97 family phage prohead protease
MTDLQLAAEPHVVIRTTGGRLISRAEDDGLTIEGYIAVWGETIRAYDWEVGEVEERIDRGAFDKSIAENTPIMLWNHGFDILGHIPVGIWTDVRADKHGLKGIGRMFGHPDVERVRETIAAGATTGMSFMAEPLQKEVTERRGKLPLLIHKELRLMEGGPVTFPAYKSTSVSVRSLWTPQPAPPGPPGPRAGAGAGGAPRHPGASRALRGRRRQRAAREALRGSPQGNPPRDPP